MTIGPNVGNAAMKITTGLVIGDARAASSNSQMSRFGSTMNYSKETYRRELEAMIDAKLAYRNGEISRDQYDAAVRRWSRFWKSDSRLRKPASTIRHPTCIDSSKQPAPSAQNSQQPKEKPIGERISILNSNARMGDVRLPIPLNFC